MTEETGDGKELSLSREIAEGNKGLAIDLTRQELPLEMVIRSTALTLAVRHCGDRVVSEGNLYQQLKMDNKLAGPLTEQHVIYAALIFERFLWGEWSKGIAGQAMEQTMDELDAAIKRKADKKIEGLEEEPPTRPHSGGENAS